MKTLFNRWITKTEPVTFHAQPLHTQEQPHELEQQLDRVRQQEHYQDLLKLLRYDPQLRALIREVVHSDQPEPVVTPRQTTPVVETGKPEPRQFDSLRQSLVLELTFLQAVNRHSAIKQRWLNDAGDDEGQQLVQLLARAAQWDEVLQLWDLLAQQCKERQRSASTDELLILDSALAVHNRIWQGRQALLQTADTICFDYEIHERVDLKGERVVEQCLPGLVNAAGKLQRKCLVKTR